MPAQPPVPTGTGPAPAGPEAAPGAPEAVPGAPEVPADTTGADGGALCPEANPTRTPTAQRSVLDRIVRQALLIEDASPRAMFELKGSLVLSAIRCVLMYAVIPLAVPLISWAGVLATPLSLVLSLAAIVLAITSLRRVWMADYRYRWPYTAFILLAVGLLTMVVVLDVRTLLG
jgi:hypothetical protein